MQVNKQAPDAALLVDLPVVLLSRILSILPDIRQLHTRAKLASVSKASASAVKQQQSIPLSGSFKACTVLSDRSLFREIQGERDEDFVRFKSTVEGQVGVLQCC
ncbi:hypothetical protein WJX82_002303 [Trebouxia sp. C0006]